MNVGIDITPVIYHRGVSLYTNNLVRALSAKRSLQLCLYGSSWRQAPQLEQFARQVKEQDAATQRSVEYRIEHRPPRLQEVFWNKLHVSPVSKAFPQLDVFHSWDWLQPPDKNLPLVSTIHDLAILKFPETAHPKILQMHQHAWRVLKEREAEIIAVSHSTRKDIIELLGFAPTKVHVVYEALPHETVKMSHTLTEEVYEQLKLQLQLDKPYILFVGTREPRKNLERLIEAWEPLAKEVQLIIAGAAGWDESHHKKVLHPEQLRFVGHVSDQQLVVLYGEAEAFVYPSLYEGFGLPILEAFYHGTPVVTSSTSSMPEVAGNAAELVDPFQVESIRSGIRKILAESKEEQQTRLQRMIIRRQLFDWGKAADETIKIYQRAHQLLTVDDRTSSP